MRRPGDLIEKDPESIEPQGFNWTAYCAELGVGVTLLTSTWFVTTIANDPSPIMLTGALVLPGDLYTQVNVGGGTVGRKYTITNRIVTTTNIPADDRSFDVLVVER